MTCENLFENKIMIFSNRGFLDAYYRANLNIGFAVESALYQVVSTLTNLPFTNNFLMTDSNDTNTFEENTNLLKFTQNMQTATETFISEVTEIMVSNRASRNNNNYSSSLNVSFFTTFEGIQSKFFKNLANYFTLFLFFHDQVAMPSFFPVYDVVDSNLDFSLFLLSDKDDLLRTNVRNLKRAEFLKYKNIFLAFQTQFLTCTLANETLINTSMTALVDTFGTVISKLKEFIRFSENFIDVLDDYIVELETYKEILCTSEYQNNINFTHTFLEQKMRNIIKNIASSATASNLTIVEGGEDFVVGDILTVPAPDSNEMSAIVEVTGIINGHIREVGISFGGQDFQVNDTLLDSAGGTTFDMIVSAIQNGFVTNATVSDGGSGFEIGDAMSSNLTQGTSEASYTIFFNNLKDNVVPLFLDTTVGNANKDNIIYWVRQTNVYQTHGGTILDSVGGSSLTYDDISDGGINNFINNSFNEFPLASGMRNILILMLVQMADYTTHAKGDLIMTILQGTNPFTLTVDYDIQDAEISSIESDYASDAQSIIQSTDGAGIEITITDVSGKLDSIILDTNALTGVTNYELTDQITISGDTSDAIIDITEIDAASLSTFSFSHDGNTDHTVVTNVEYDSNLRFEYGASSFEASINSLHFENSDLEVVNNTDSNSQLNDTFYLDINDTDDIQMKVTQLECQANTIELEIDSASNSGYQINETFSPTIDGNAFTTEVTSLQIDSNSISLTSSASTYEPSEIGTSFSGMSYGGGDTNVDISATVTGILMSANSIDLDIVDSNDSNYSITSVTTVDYGTQEITITPTEISIEANALSSLIEVDSNSSFTPGESFEMEYGGDSVNLITATIDEITIPADTISFSPVDTNDTNNYGTYTISIGGDSNITVVYDSNTIVTTHPELQLTDITVDDTSGLFALDTPITGSSSSFTVTHDAITATNNTFTDSNGHFSLSETPTGTLSNFTVTHSQFTLTDSNAVLTPSTFTFNTTPTGTLVLDVSHNEIIAIDNSFISDSNNIVALASTPTGSIVTFSQSHPLINDLSSETYNADSSPFVLKAGHPFGTMNAFSIETGTLIIDVDKIIVDGSEYKLNSYTSDSNILISDWDIQFTNKPSGIIVTMDTSSISNQSYGVITDSDVIEFAIDSNLKDYYTMSIASAGSIYNYEKTSDGEGFANTDTLSLSSSNGNTGANLPSVTSFTIKEGEITSFTINEGGLNYDVSDIVIISKTGATDALLNISSVRDGIISAITINDGGSDYTLSNTLTVESSGGGNGAQILLSDIDNGHISTISIIDEGSGFTTGDTIEMTHSRDSTLPNQPTIEISSISSDDTISILAKIKDLNDALED